MSIYTIASSAEFLSLSFLFMLRFIYINSVKRNEEKIKQHLSYDLALR